MCSAVSVALVALALPVLFSVADTEPVVAAALPPVVAAESLFVCFESPVD